eukprot:1835138-Prorocentrum_lima.AAC.1
MKPRPPLGSAISAWTVTTTSELVRRRPTAGATGSTWCTLPEAVSTFMQTLRPGSCGVAGAAFTKA